VQAQVPSFPQKPWPITCRHLLGHQSGIRAYRGDEIDSTRRYLSVRAGLAIFEGDPLLFEPGTKYAYSTYGYNLLGAAVEGASGAEFRAYLKAHVFEPAGMATIRDDDAQALIPHRASGYRLLNGELRRSALADVSNKVPGGGLIGTPTDLVAFGRALDSGRLLDAEWLGRMTALQTTAGGQPTSYGLGVFVKPDPSGGNGREVWHGGNQPQVTTLWFSRPDRDTTVVIFTNLERAQLGTLARALADAVEAAP
jgi:CubicO group peptidase (beta-lactamase class C family)